MGAKKSLTGEEMDPEAKEQQEAQQKLADAEALAMQQAGIDIISTVSIRNILLDINGGTIMVKKLFCFTRIFVFFS